MVKRDVMILPYERGGLNMFNLRAKLECMAMQNFLYIAREHKRINYNLSIFWLKFYLRELKLNNFNIIPCGSDDERPREYEFMISCYKMYKIKNQKFNMNENTISSKILYEFFRERYEKRPTCESDIINIDWNDVYKKLLDKNLDSNLRIINFKILNNALSLNIKYSNRIQNRCYLCKNSKEELDHLFIDCQVTNRLFKDSVAKYFEKDFKYNKNSIYFSKNLDKKETKILSIFKYCIWKIRNMAKKENYKNFEFFKKLFKKKLYYFKNND
jgi:hypothetical protein